MRVYGVKPHCAQVLSTRIFPVGESNEILTGVVVAFMLAVEVELRVDGAEVLTMILLVSTKSCFSMGCCEITIGCGGGT